MTDTTQEWLEDANGNRCSVDYWGSAEAAQKALDSLVDCDNCINCSRCSDCSCCSGCSGCSGCSRCSDCSDCSCCSDCSDCSDCSRCSDKKDHVGDFTPPQVPSIANIHSAILAAVDAPDALNMGAWHTCGTMHCRAGWAVHLAGEAGYALERFHGTALAAQLIYRASGYQISPVRFYETNEVAMADMRRLAGASA